MGNDDRVSSWAAAVVVDRFRATCPWGMLLTKQFNERSRSVVYR